MKTFSLAFALTLAAVLPAQAEEKTHLFILSGQSNMAGLKPEISFKPTVNDALKGNKVIVVKSAQGGQPIRRWYKAWKPAKGDQPAADGKLYDDMMTRVNEAIGDNRPDTVTFVWMQGERDAKEMHGSVYAASLRGLIDQLQTDMKREDINFVIGRLSDFGNGGKNDWDVVRKAQVEVAEASERGAWVDTDDLNGPKNGLHYNAEGYAELGKRFAEKALALVGESE